MGSPSCLGYCGGQAASPKPPSSSARTRSIKLASDPAWASISALGSPLERSRAGTVSIRSSAGSTLATSSHVRGVDTRASGVGRTL